MRVLVTGAAGFIGRRTVSALVEAGHRVVALDRRRPEGDRALGAPQTTVDDRAEFHRLDLRTADLGPVLAGVDVVIHLAARPGVRASWADIDQYLGDNVLATQRLLAAATGRVGRVVYASSSSVYGDAIGHDTGEGDPLAPRSPYGVTKLSGEQLCRAYTASHDLATVSLRYFTVFGPGQRSDMAIHRLIEAADRGDAFRLYGDGTQVRDVTFVDDVVAANVAAATGDVEPGSVYNVAGGAPVELRHVIETVESLTGRTITIERRPPAPGDVARTSGRTKRIEADLGWRPRTDLEHGLTAQIEWQRTHRADIQPPK